MSRGQPSSLPLSRYIIHIIHLITGPDPVKSGHWYEGKVIHPILVGSHRIAVNSWDSNNSVLLAAVGAQSKYDSKEG